MAAPYEQREKSHIEKRRRRWYAVMDVPSGVRILGKNGKAVRKLTATLRTESLSIAEKRAAPIIARWQRQIDRARGATVETDAEFYRRVFTPEEIAAVKELAEEQAYWIGAADPNADDPHESAEAARHYEREVRKYTAEPFATHLDAWLEASKATEKTQAMQRADVLRFAKDHRALADVNKAAVRKWCDKLMGGDDGLTLKTMQRILSALRGYWSYLQSIEAAPIDSAPFNALALKDAGRARDEDKRKPLTGC